MSAGEPRAATNDEPTMDAAEAVEEDTVIMTDKGPASETPAAGPEGDDEWRFDAVEEAIEEIRAGRIVLVVDDADRENEGDFVMAAQKVTPEAINFMVTHGRGIVCLPVTGERLDQLGIPLMVAARPGSHDTCSSARGTRRRRWTWRGWPG
jgi:hypothetical protein